MSTSPTFNTVTAKSINLANPGSMSAAGTVIAQNITATGNIVANNGAARQASFSRVSASGNVTGANFITLGVVNAVTQIRSTQIIANNSMSIGSTTTIQNSGVTTANLIATGNVTGSNFFTAGRVSAAGNVAGNYILGNGYFLTGLAGGVGTYGNGNVAQYLPTYTGALAGANLTVGSSTLINNNLSLQNIVAAANITAGRINSGTMSLSGNVTSALAVSGNVTATNVNTPGRVSATGNVQGGNLVAIGTVSALGNISGNYIFGNGAFLTGVANGGGGSDYGNANVVANLAALSSNPISTTGNVTAGRLQIGATVLTANSLSVNQDVVAGRNITAANLTGTLQTAQQPQITRVGTLANLTVSGQMTAASLSTSGAISAAGTIIGGDISGSTISVSGAGQIGSGLNVTGSISATGTVRGGNLQTTGMILAAGSITGGSIQTDGTVSAGGNVTGSNLRTVGVVSATGNITGQYILGNGAFLTGIANGGGSDYGNANVAAYLPTYAGTLNPASLSTTGAVTAASLQIGPSTLTTNSLSVPLDVVAGRNINGANLFGTIRTASQTGITQVGTLGTLAVAGQIQAGSLALSGAISAAGAITGATMTGTALSISGSGTIGAVSILGGSITGSALGVSGQVSAGTLVSSGGAISAAGTIIGATMSASGNVTGLNMIGNGYSLTNVLRSNATRTVYVSTSAPTGAQGVSGDIWYQTY